MSVLDNIINFFSGVKTTPEVDNTKQLRRVKFSKPGGSYAKAQVSSAEATRKQKLPTANDIRNIKYIPNVNNALTTKDVAKNVARSVSDLNTDSTVRTLQNANAIRQQSAPTAPAIQTSAPFNDASSIPSLGESVESALNTFGIKVSDSNAKAEKLPNGYLNPGKKSGYEDESMSLSDIQADLENPRPVDDVRMTQRMNSVSDRIEDMQNDPEFTNQLEYARQWQKANDMSDEEERTELEEENRWLAAKEADKSKPWWERAGVDTSDKTGYHSRSALGNERSLGWDELPDSIDPATREQIERYRSEQDQVSKNVALARATAGLSALPGQAQLAQYIQDKVNNEVSGSNGEALTLGKLPNAVVDALTTQADKIGRWASGEEDVKPVQAFLEPISQVASSIIAPVDYTPDEWRGVYENYFNSQKPVKSKDVEDQRNLDENYYRDENGNNYFDERIGYYNPIDGLDSLNHFITDTGIVDTFDSDLSRIGVESDDGSAENRESPYITGEEYYRQRLAGVPGRPLSEIDLNEKAYSKFDEQKNFGYIPYIVTKEGADEFRRNAGPEALSKVFSDFGNARMANADYGVEYKGKKYSGHDIESKTRQFNKKFEDSFKNGEIVTDKNKIDPNNAVGMRYVVRDANGDISSVATDEPWFMRYNGQEIEGLDKPAKKGQILLNMGKREDGSNIWEVFDSEKDIDGTWEIAEDPGEAIGWLDVEPMVLDDGTVVPASDAYELANNNRNYIYDNGVLGLGTPQTRTPFLNEEGGIGDPLPWLVDMALQSAPLFTTPTAATQALAQVNSTLTGMGSGPRANLYGGYDREADWEKVLTKAVGAALLPSTERLWGNLGKAQFGTPIDWAWKRLRTKEGLAKDISKALGDSAENVPKDIIEDMVNDPKLLTNLGLMRPITKTASGALGEGMEEIPGNIVEELMNSGLVDWYKDYDDETGERVDTDVWGRLSNFIEDIPEAMLGGAALGGVLNVPMYPAYRAERPQIIRNEVLRRLKDKEEGRNVKSKDSNDMIDESDPSKTNRDFTAEELS